MKRINWLFTLSSLNVLLVTIERFSFTTKILFQPFNFIRLHEIIQMTILILFTVVLPFLILKEVSRNFDLLKSNHGLILVLTFLIGVYFYATGNGVHEISSFNFNNFCDVESFAGDLCGGFFINDYYTGNTMYFFGGILMLIPLLLFEKNNPNKDFNSKDLRILLINAAVYALAIFAYAAFDRVLVGLIYSLIMLGISGWIFWKVKKKYVHYPVITYTFATYALGTIPAILLKLLS